MAELDPFGGPALDGDVAVSSPGFAGDFFVTYPESISGRSVGSNRFDWLVDRLEDLGFEEQLIVEVAAVPVEVGTTAERSTELARPGLAVEVPGPSAQQGQLALLVDDDGETLSWRFGESGDESAVTSRAGGVARMTYTIDADVSGESVDSGRTDRGLFGAVGRKLLKVFVFPLVDALLGRVGDFFAERWERRNRWYRLRGFAPADYLSNDVDELSPDALRTFGKGPSLLFIHGTLSRTSAAFGSLPSAFVERLHERYSGRVFAFDHPTASASPLENAHWLAERLPPDASLEVDIVAHSRGGLVARELAERSMMAGITAGALRVRRLTFVATPNAGTRFCQVKYVGALLDSLTNLIGLAPDNPVTDTLEIICAVAKQIAVGAFRGLDGLMAMDPDGEYLRELNRGGATDTLYCAVSADFDPKPGDSVRRRLRDRVTDAIFLGEPNDLVVPTRGVHAANGAACFPIEDVLEFRATEAIDHSGFWKRTELHEFLDRRLLG
jgi:pimeloyl-ACP methyl ester carboxylesterase